MEDLDTRENDWARGVFDRARTGQNEPHWTPDAATAARAGNRQRIRFRATGALAVAAIAGLSATAFVALGGGTAESNAVGPGGGGHQFSPPQDAKHIAPASGLGKYATIGIGYSEGKKTNPDQEAAPATAAATIGTVLSAIDPSLTHVRANALPVKPLTIVADTPEFIDAATGLGFWTTDGDSTVLHGDQNGPSTPMGSVLVTMWTSRTAAEEQQKPTVACGLGHAVFVPGYLLPTAWSPCAQQTQSDGSVITTTHSTGTTGGEILVAARRFRDGSMVVVAADSVIHYNTVHGVLTPLGPGAAEQQNVAGAALNPVPWTDDTLGDALSGPGVKGLP